MTVEPSVSRTFHVELERVRAELETANRMMLVLEHRLAGAWAEIVRLEHELTR